MFQESWISIVYAPLARQRDIGPIAVAHNADISNVWNDSIELIMSEGGSEVRPRAEGLSLMALTFSRGRACTVSSHQCNWQ